jgi:hypothetical protein
VGKTFLGLCALACALTGGRCLAVVPNLEPLSTFGGGDGWVAPGERTYLTTDNTQRGLAYNPVTGNLLLVSRAGGGLSVNVLNGTTGANVGTLPLASFMTGDGTGVFPLSMIAAADDGAIYATNLAVTSSQQFRVYRWENESAAPTMPFIGQPGDNSPRLGDTLDVRGSGEVNTTLLIGTSGGGNKGYLTISTAGGAPYSPTTRSFTTTPPQENDHSLGITFAEGDTVIGTRGGLRNFVDLQPARFSSFADGIPTLLASPELTSQGERPMDFAEIGGVPVLATVDTISSVVRAYDFTDPENPILLDALTTVAGASNANGFGVGQLRFGEIEGDTATIYALNTNNGIQAFTLTVPEPASAGLLALGAVAVGGARRRGPSRSGVKS